MDTRPELKEYQDRLWGLIPTERITRFKIERPAPEVIAGYRALEEPTPTLSDVLDSMGINGTISAGFREASSQGCDNRNMTEKSFDDWHAKAFKLRWIYH